MRTVRATHIFSASVADAQALWYDTARWVDWVDGVDAVEGDWPRPGATVTWQSGPAGRGHVTERVVRYEPLEGQTLEVSDDSIRGEQTITFAPEEADVRVTLSLAYRITRRSPITPLIDLLFIRRAMADSLDLTLTRFGGNLEYASPRAP
jgi:hypothetical protein